MNQKNPFIAVLLSCFIIGAGQIYCGIGWSENQIKKGIAYLAIFVIGVCISIAFFQMGSMAWVICIFILFIAWFIGIIDSYSTVTKINNSEYSFAVVNLLSVDEGVHLIFTTKGAKILVGIMVVILAISFVLFISMLGGGSIHIISNPAGASVYLDSEYKGQTPLTMPLLANGAYELTISKDGYDKWAQTLHISTGDSITIDAALTEKNMSGSLYITSSPSSAYVFVDNYLKGTTPCTITGVSPGSHNVEVSKAGYKSSSAAVSVKTDQQTSKSFVLSASDTGILYVKVIPSTAEIYVDGVNKGSGNRYFTDYTAGTYSITVVADGYKGVHKSLKVNSGEQTNSTIELSDKRGGIDVSFLDSEWNPVGYYVCKYLVSNYGDETVMNVKVTVTLFEGNAASSSSSDPVISSDTFRISTLKYGESEVITGYFYCETEPKESYWSWRWTND